MKYVVARDTSAFIDRYAVGDDITESRNPQDSIADAVSAYLADASKNGSFYSDPLTFMVNLHLFYLVIITPSEYNRDIITEIKRLDTVDMETVAESGGYK
jgi:hypothetical protein